MTGIPYPHAISTILYHSDRPEQYLHEYYSVEYYKKAYDPMIYPVPSEDQWVRTGQDEVDPPALRASPGRPKRLRRRGPDEPKNSHCMRKGGSTMRCSKCRAVSHNARTCPRRKRVSTPSSSRASVPMSTATELRFGDVSLYPKYMLIIKCIKKIVHDFPNFDCFKLQIPSQLLADDSQPRQSSTIAQPVLRPGKILASSTVGEGISNICYYKYIFVLFLMTMLHM
jgi:hypothetical protein